MSAVSVNQLFEEIEQQYEEDGTIDDQKKVMLLQEMKKFKGGEKFVQQMHRAFQQIENADDDGGKINTNDDGIEAIEISQPSIVKSRRFKLKFNVVLTVYNLFQFTCNVEKH